MKKIKDFENHQEKVIQEMRERFLIYKMKKKKRSNSSFIGVIEKCQN